MKTPATAIPAALLLLLLVACGGDSATPGDGGGADAASTPDTASAPDATTAIDASDEEDVAGPAQQGIWTLLDGDPNFAVAAAGWYRGDLHYHTDYSEDAKEQGGDPLAVCLDIADAYRDPAFVGAYPELAGNGLDYIAITDHRTDDALADPDFEHDHLIVLPAEEYGGSGHANIFGIEHHIPHNPLAGESDNERHLDAIEEAHVMGAFFSPNHPLDENNWVWDTPSIDGIEIWNGPWAGFYLGSSEEELDHDIDGSGVENPFIRDAWAHASAGSHNAMAVRFWQNHLTAGLHVAPIGGSDRHMIFPAGLPTTYVRRPDAHADLQGKDLGWQGVVAGLHDGGTFVSRSPFGAQVVMEAIGPDGDVHPMGAELPGAGPWTIRIRVGRAEGGLFRLVGGPLKPAEPDGTWSAAPEVLLEEAVPGDLVETEWVWTPPAGGGWLHAEVLELLAPDPLPPEAQTALEVFQTPAQGDALIVLAEVMLPFIDGDDLLFPDTCDPAEWQPWMLQCMPTDQVTLGSFYVPERMERLVHIVYDGDAPTEWAMGAISSAFLVRP